MVHGGKTQPISNYEMAGRSAEARKAGFEAIQAKSKYEATSSKTMGSSGSYGSWGPTFKNKDNFASLHHC